ncbi:hypothetical protein HRF80_05835 [Enterococcus faecalis]|nr:hypothetical protein [Enterococcus faecalis]
MTKIFEDEFMDWQADMVDIAKEYIDDRAEKIYLYGSIEGGTYAFNLFYQINNKIVFMSKVNDALKNFEEKYDVSSDRRRKVLEIGVQDLKEIAEVCKKYDKPISTQFKLYYDVQKNNLKAKYQYDLQYSNTEDLYTDDIFMAWYEEVKSAVENPQEFGF